MDHHTSIHQVGEGRVQAACSCGWRSPVFGADKATGTMDPVQHATKAADLHQWEMSLPWAATHAGHDSARPSPANAGGRRRGRAP